MKKDKKLTICLTKEEYEKLDEIRNKSEKSVSYLLRDSLHFYSLVYGCERKK